MVSVSELVRGFAAVLATVAVIIGLLGLGTSITDQTAVLRSLLATAAGAILLSILIVRERSRRIPAPRPVPVPRPRSSIN